jgi:hypothetical protein
MIQTATVQKELLKFVVLNIPDGGPLTLRQIN